ncbi:hypothetical protein A0J61_04365 [Choanephora cucurbitarum]|uniref:Uncharacterized protein n=1 Tax=Choanephora cucurbitarum TaxID=101091 RepID=A0A1C7NEQ4_9FUNG|nr:hypothetical protein A0J61_04365 [Choanephora cucurbitarum]
MLKFIFSIDPFAANVSALPLADSSMPCNLDEVGAAFPGSYANPACSTDNRLVQARKPDKPRFDFLHELKVHNHNSCQPDDPIPSRASSFWYTV